MTVSATRTGAAAPRPRAGADLLGGVSGDLGTVCVGAAGFGVVVFGSAVVGAPAVAAPDTGAAAPSGVTLKKPLHPFDAMAAATMSAPVPRVTRQRVGLGAILPNIPHHTMTERLYYTDAYQTSFSATVQELSDDAQRVYLDRTAFYPTSGGQPHDLGTLGGVSVIDVIDEDARIAHLLSAPLARPVGTTVDGRIDAVRRFDLMQQHTGQHLLSALFADQYGSPTVSVHFGADYSTIDVQGTGLDSNALQDAETRANALVFSNRDVTVSFEDAATAAGLRKSSDRGGTLRVVTIAELDRSACGGTHVRRTGEIGSVLLRGAERTKGNTRIEFLAGYRAVSRARADAALLSTAARHFTAAPDDVPLLVERQQQRVLELEREHRRLSNELARYEARSQWDAATANADGLRRIRINLEQGAVRDIEPLAQSLIALGACVVLASTRAPAGVLFAAAEDSGIDAGQTLRAALAAVGGRGGGSPRVAQGSVPDMNSLATLATTLGFD